MYVVACTSITCKQCFYFLPQLGVAVASLIQQSCSALTVAFRDAMKQLLDLRPTFRSQVGPMPFGPDGKATLPPSSDRDGRLQQRLPATEQSHQCTTRRNNEA